MADWLPDWAKDAKRDYWDSWELPDWWGDTDVEPAQEAACVDNWCASSPWSNPDDPYVRPGFMLPEFTLLGWAVIVVVLYGLWRVFVK